MKKIITTVGTSIITNCLQDNQDLRSQFDLIKDKFSEDWESEKSIIEILKKRVNDWAKNKKEKASAEIQSILKIKEELNEDIEVFLISTDTILSRLAAEIIKEWFQNNILNITIFFNTKQDIIKGLQVLNYINFRNTGLINLLNRLNQITQKYWGDFIINITGGYKALIPYMTIISQMHSIPSYYVFQDDSDKDFNLLQIPQLPIDLKENIFEKYGNYFLSLENLDIGNKDEFPYDFISECSSCLEIDGNQIVINPLGKLLWEKYQSKYFLFFAPDEVWEEINKLLNVKRIIQSKFFDKQLRSNKTETKGDHIVFDDGNNDNRIYYFEVNGIIWIYKVFESEEKAKKFILENINKEEVIRKSKIRKIEINN